MKSNFLKALCLFSVLAQSCTDTTPSNSESEPTNNKTERVESAASIPSLKDLQNNPDILWVGETHTDYALNYHSWDATVEEKSLMKDIGFKGKNYNKILKYQIDDINKGDNDDYKVMSKIMANMDEISFYEDDNLSQKLSSVEARKIVSSIDTIIVFDPNTGKELTQVVVNSLNPDDIHFFRLKQLIYYSKKEIAFKSIPLALAPVVSNTDKDGNFVSAEPLFWIKPRFLDKTPDLNVASITWAKRLYRSIELKNVKQVKGEKGIEKIIGLMMEDLRTNSDRVYLAHTFDADGSEQMSQNEIKNLGGSIDTIITFNPKTHEEITQVVVNKMNPEEVEKIRIFQDWVWDEAQKEMSLSSVGFAAVISRHDENGNFLNSGPMFIRPLGKDKVEK